MVYGQLYILNNKKANKIKQTFGKFVNAFVRYGAMTFE